LRNQAIRGTFIPLWSDIHHKFRWLSMDRAVGVLIKIMPAVICALHEIQAMQPTEKRAGPLAKKIATHTFVGALSLMADVLPVFAQVCTLFQTEVRDSA
jgi:hypothetical protein